MAKALKLDTLSLTELKSLKKDIEKAISKSEKSKRQQARVDAEKVAQKHGFSLSELVGGKPKRSAKAKSPAKYRHPEDADKTWSGRGRQPFWFKEALKAGTPALELEI